MRWMSFDKRAAVQSSRYKSERCRYASRVSHSQEEGFMMNTWLSIINQAIICRSDAYKNCKCDEKGKTIDRAVGIRSFMDLARVCESQSAAVGASVADHITTP